MQASETEPKEHEIEVCAYSLDMGVFLELMRQVHTLGFVAGQSSAYRETLGDLNERIPELEDEVQRKQGDPFVLGEISSLARFAAAVKRVSTKASAHESKTREGVGDYFADMDLLPFLEQLAATAIGEELAERVRERVRERREEARA